MAKEIEWSVESASNSFSETFVDYNTWSNFMINEMGLDATTYQINEATFNRVMWFMGDLFLKYANINKNRIECYYQWKNTVDYINTVTPLYDADIKKLFATYKTTKQFAPSGDIDEDNKDKATTYLYNTTENQQDPTLMEQIMRLRAAYFTQGINAEEFLVKNFAMKVMALNQPRLEFYEKVN